ncbi:hypothetical protein ACFL6G_09050 [candidate division KSB1 bacterium]
MFSIKRISQISCSIILVSLILTNAYGQVEFTMSEKIKDNISGFSIKKPVRWLDTFKNQGSDQRTLILSSNSENSGSAVNILVFAQKPQSKNVGEYAKKLIGQYAKTYKEFELTEKKAILLNDIPFSSFLIEYEFDGVKYKMNSIFTLQNDKIYQINIIAPAEIYDNEINVINRVISTFEIS